MAPTVTGKWYRATSWSRKLTDACGGIGNFWSAGAEGWPDIVGVAPPCTSAGFKSEQA
ncbi:hypothetical protein Ga0123461_2451 [Mariprofundus aestuarium]|uniref:Uncharacterized protein n=1 Tax=Mariprofundus aestuarium TaxID=1921086 RepID=A0A2K8L0L8_MARES|nr:hypothetical protein [Mariprofundus aestuarium]ATX80850.1 hypothetical protein Ga0123461_2451 [Mariprofundus aestuarium]